MDSEDYHEFEDKSARLGDGWDDFRCDDGDPISIEHLKLMPLAEMPADVRLLVLDNYFPELEQAAELAVQWAEGYVRDFAKQQAMKLPWLKRP